jgi:phage recombination protein Bet
MSQAIEKKELPGPVARRGLDEFTWRSLVNSVFPGAQSESILMAVDYCKARGLDVLKKPVHIVPMYVKDAKTGESNWRDIIMPGISELRTTAARTGQYAGQDEPVFGLEVEYKGVRAPETCTVTVYRFTQGHKVSFTHTERFREAVATKKGGEVNSMWSKRPYAQLAKCAEAGALRKAFPEEIGNEYAAEEMIGREIDGGMDAEPGQRAMPQRKSETSRVIEAEPLDAVIVTREPGDESEPTGAAPIDKTDELRKKAENLYLALAQLGRSDDAAAAIDKAAGVSTIEHVQPGDLATVIAGLEKLGKVKK